MTTQTLSGTLSGAYPGGYLVNGAYTSVVVTGASAAPAW